MLGRHGRGQLEHFAGSLRDLIPDDYILVPVDPVSTPLGCTRKWPTSPLLP
jgi:hypothetical protein